jgi:hypothetical protein
VTTQILLLLFAILAPPQILHAQAIAEEKVPPLVFGAMLQRYPRKKPSLTSWAWWLFYKKHTPPRPGCGGWGAG